MGEIIVVGGGASGMTAAIAAARAGACVTILEQNSILGKKILSTGNGRCNLTNLNLDACGYRGDHPEFVREILDAFGSKEAADFFASLGICTKCRGEYVYPLCDQASAVREAFVMEVRSLGIRVETECHVERIRKKDGAFHVFCGEGRPCRKASRLILAAGSRASEISGSDGSGYRLAEKLGHSLSPVVPALVQLRGKGSYFKRLAGLRTAAAVSVYADGAFAARDEGELQITDYGISGIPVFQISRYAAKALAEKKDVTVQIDFAPHLSGRSLFQELLARSRRWSDRTGEEMLNTLFPSRLIPVLLSEGGIGAGLRAGKIPPEKWRAFARTCKSFPVQITETNSFRKAQVCAGGIRTDEIWPNSMESRLVKGLYVTGEILDVDGICGGYNLHFAWATGNLAGTWAAR